MSAEPEANDLGDCRLYLLNLEFVFTTSRKSEISRRALDLFRKRVFFFPRAMLGFFPAMRLFTACTSPM